LVGTPAAAVFAVLSNDVKEKRVGRKGLGEGHQQKNKKKKH
jgi:hypothetical protein